MWLDPITQPTVSALHCFTRYKTQRITRSSSPSRCQKRSRTRSRRRGRGRPRARANTRNHNRTCRVVTWAPLSPCGCRNQRIFAGASLVARSNFVARRKIQFDTSGQFLARVLANLCLWLSVHTCVFCVWICVCVGTKATTTTTTRTRNYKVITIPRVIQQGQLFI